MLTIPLDTPENVFLRRWIESPPPPIKTMLMSDSVQNSVKSSAVKCLIHIGQVAEPFFSGPFFCTLTFSCRFNEKKKLQSGWCIYVKKTFPHRIHLFPHNFSCEGLLWNFTEFLLYLVKIIGSSGENRILHICWGDSLYLFSPAPSLQRRNRNRNDNQLEQNETSVE